MKNILLLLLLFPSLLIAQSGGLAGKIHDAEYGIPLVNVVLNPVNLGDITDIEGAFKIEEVPVGTYELLISAMGYQKRKLKVDVKNNQITKLDVKFKEATESLEEVVVTGTLKEIRVKDSSVPIEVYTPSYFKKNPTPSLFEALQIVYGVRPQINCSVCNTGDVHINGMEGAYTMVTIDGMPIVGGLASVYGLNGIPNSIIQQMEVVKGPASTLFGSEAVGGLINVITKSPKKSPKFSVDVMGTSWEEINTDISARFSFGSTTSILGVNYFKYGNPIDNNKDNFTDVTLSDRISVFNKWDFNRTDEKLSSLAIRYIYEDRWGGEMQFDKRKHRGGDEVYGESIFTSRIELIGKYQLPVEEEVFFSFSGSIHDQNSMYGNTSYIADQDIIYAQLHWNKRLGNNHDLLVGAAYRYTFYDDNTAATFSPDPLNKFNLANKTHLPGVFLQDDITINKKNKLLLGVRIDNDSRHGNIFTPRINYKWSPNNENTVRLSYGTGFRVVNLFTEDHAATIGAREVVIQDELKPEKSHNANIHYKKYVYTNFGFIDFNTSLFYTYFSNKITPDYDTNPQQIIYANTEGYAISQGLSFNMAFNFEIPLKIKIGGTFLDVYEMVEDDQGKLNKEQQLLTEKVSGTFSASYSFHKSKINIDYSGNLYGPMKLPLVENDFRPEYSDWYSIQNVKVSKTFKNGIELYGGIKNILNFTPPAYSILRANDPFDKNVNSPENPNGYTFDPTYVYAPNQGVRGFLGLSYTLK
jgi:outer membrane receptor for ferrienterochelin and colicins